MQRETIYLIGKHNFFAEKILIEAVKNLLKQKGELCFIDGQSVKIKNLLFRRKMADREPTNKYEHLTGFKCMIVVMQVAISGSFTIAECLYLSIRRNLTLKRAMLNLTYRKIPIGDCIASSYMRSFRDTISLDFKYFRLIFQVIKDLIIWEKVLSRLICSGKRKFFLIPERVYHDEALRRLLLSRGFYELRQSHLDGKLRKIRHRQKGTQLYLDVFYSKKTDQSSMKRIKQEIHDYAEGNKNYDYMERLHQKKKKKVSFLHEKDINTAAIIYLHAISDAQYIFGVGCFADLHEWLQATVAICQKVKLPLIIKCNPVYFMKEGRSPIDAMYVKRLERLFHLSLAELPTGRLHATSHRDVYFVSHQHPTKDLVRHISKPLFLTHHGTVASEAAYFRKTCIVSDASPFTYKDRFVHIYQTKSQYEELVWQWHQGYLIEKKGAYSSLLRWCARRNFSADLKNQYYQALLKQYYSVKRPKGGRKSGEPSLKQMENFFRNKRETTIAVKTLERILQPCKI
jgi:hypothetical protein